jgi:hypothetical protein
MHFHFLRFLFVMIASLAVAGVTAQGVPVGISYQAIVRDPSGNEIVNETVTVEFAIRLGAPDGPITYEEFHATVITNQYGLFNVNIGNGVNTGNGTYSSLALVPWGSDVFFLEVRATIPGQGASEIIGVSQLLTVPYAFFANRAQTVAVESDGDTQNELIDDFSLNGTVLTITENNADYAVDLSGLIGSGGNDNDPENELITSAQISQTYELTVTEGGNNTSIDLSSVAYATWQEGVNSVFQNEHRVGIGTDSPQSGLHLEGSLSLSVATLTGGFYDFNSQTDLADKSVFVCNVSDEDVTIELPSATVCSGRIYKFRKFFSGVVTSNDVNLSAVADEYVDGQSVFGMNHIYAEYLTIISDGSNWYVIDHSKE